MKKVVRPNYFSDKDDEKITRKQTSLRVYVLPEEKAAIEANAHQAGLSVAAYLRNVGLGYRVTGITDHKHVEELVRINGDLGRLGGLLKLWLTNSEKTKKIGLAHIAHVLSSIEQTQAEMLKTIRLIVTPRSQD